MKQFENWFKRFKKSNNRLSTRSSASKTIIIPNHTKTGTFIERQKRCEIYTVSANHCKSCSCTI